MGRSFGAHPRGFGHIARGPDGPFPFLHDARHRPQQQAIENHRQEQDKDNDPDDRQVWEHSEPLARPQDKTSIYTMISTCMPFFGTIWPIRAARTPAASSEAATPSDHSEAAAIRSPPEVWGSYSRDMRSVSTLSAWTIDAKCSWLDIRPPDRFFAAIVSTPVNRGTCPASIWSVTPLAAAISLACPISPNPVMSVHACT